MRTTLRSLALAGSSLCAISMVAALPVHAQAQTRPQQAPAPTAADPQSDAATLDEVVVTGSRAATAGYNAATPTSVVSSAAIERQGAANIAQVLNLDPAFKPVQSAGGNGIKTATPGSATADLRGLGGQRTLVLVNGMRVVPVAPTTFTNVVATTDLNLIPALLIDRVEVVTGGASAQWGSDAVAGVVNILLRNQFEGAEFKIQGGQSQEGDYDNYRFGALLGRSFLDGRAHAVFGMDYESNAGLGDIYTRDWGRQEYQIITNPNTATNGLPVFLSVPNVHSALGAGGVIAGPANFTFRNFTFEPGGQTVRPFQFGSVVSGVQMVGGEGESVLTGLSLAPKVERVATYARFEYKPRDWLTAAVELSYSESTGSQFGSKPRFTNLVIQRDNAFLPDVVRAAMVAQNIPSFTFNRSGYDIGNSQNVVKNEIPHAAFSLRADLENGWSWDVNYSVGRDNYHQEVRNANNRVLTAFALDAVANPAGGAPVCRATLAGPAFNAAAAGCVPLNLFGDGSPSAAALAYVQATGTSESVYDQHVVTANLRGQPFSLPAGPVSLAIGAEFRKEEQTATASPTAARGDFNGAGNATPFSGDFDVSEGYLDAIVPLIADAPFAKSLDFNGAFRVANYSTVGTQMAWKVGLTYEPFDGLRFRTTRSTDFRAPAIYELSGRGQQVTNVVSVRGRSFNIPQNVTLGNPNLDAETSSTFTAGVVIEPGGFLSGLRTSLDYYDVKIDDAIASLSAATIGSFCTAGNATFCSFFTFDGTGAATALSAGVLNIATFETRGLDFSLDYGVGVGSILGAPARLSLSAKGTYVIASDIDLGSGTGPVDRAGENSEQNAGATPELRLNLSQTLTAGRGSLTLQQIYVSEGKIDNTFNTLPTNTINDNEVEAVTYLNVYGTWDLSDHLQLFGAVDNALDRDPAIVPYPNLPVPATNGMYYNKVGRAFRVGLTYKF